MPVNDPVLQEIVRRIVDVAAPERILLFGSRAKGEAKPDSDYDLLVVRSGVPHRRRLAQAIYRNMRGIMHGVDVIVETPEHLAETAGMPGLIYAEALREGTVVYEQ